MSYSTPGLSGCSASALANWSYAEVKSFMSKNFRPKKTAFANSSLLAGVAGEAWTGVAWIVAAAAGELLDGEASGEAGGNCCARAAVVTRKRARPRVRVIEGMRPLS